jgi:hypothetical protein
MHFLRSKAAAPSAGAELSVLLLVTWLAFISVPLSLGGIGLSWDALNHHVYLGWIADEPRFNRDFLAASYQSFQYPYLYWPVYKLAQSGLSGQWAGAILVSLNIAVVPALWLLARTGIPERSWYGSAMRLLAIALAFLGSVVLSMFDATANDLLAAIPLVWAVALAMEPWSMQRPRWATTRRLILLSGFCSGTAVAFKLSNGPLAVVIPLLWAWPGSSLRERAAHVMWGSLAAVTGFILLYGYWGWQLWIHYGNPIYPFYGNWFGPLPAWLGPQR